MRKGKRIAILEAKLDVLGDRANIQQNWLRAIGVQLQGLERVAREVCPHRAICYRSKCKHGPYTFECELCRRTWYYTEADALPRFRKILEACGVLEPATPRVTVIETAADPADLRTAQAICAWANARRAPGTAPFAPDDFVSYPASESEKAVPDAVAK